MSPKLVELEFLLAPICKNNKVRILNKRIIAYLFFFISNCNYIKKRKGAQPLYTGSIQENP